MKTSTYIRNGVVLFLSVLLVVACNTKSVYKPQTHTVEIKDMSFQPADLNVHKGDTVIWINKDIVAHDVTQDAKAWASPPLASGESWKKTITQSDSYYCSIHVVMKGQLTVEE